MELRRDARRNRERIIDAGRELFSDSSTVPMYLVARRAGIGQATLYRHFPDRYALISVIFELEFVALAEFAAQLAGEPDGVVALLQDLTRRITGLRGLAEIVRTESSDAARRSRQDEIGALFEKLLPGAKTAGTVRADLEVEDIFLIISMIEGAVVGEPNSIQRRATADRALTLVLGGVRPPSWGSPGGDASAPLATP